MKDVKSNFHLQFKFGPLEPAALLSIFHAKQIQFLQTLLLHFGFSTFPLPSYLSLNKPLSESETLKTWHGEQNRLCPTSTDSVASHIIILGVQWKVRIYRAL